MDLDDGDAAPGLRCQVCGGDAYRPYTHDEAGDFVRCQDCGLIVRHPCSVSTSSEPPAPAQEGYYDMYQGRRAHKVWDDGRRLQAFLHYLEMPHARQVDHLDIGCGLGSMVEAGATRLGLNSRGVDLPGHAVECCRGRGFDVAEGSLTATGAADGSFDLVTVINVLEHIPRTDDGLREIHRVLRPGGILGAIVPSGAYLKAHLLRQSYRNYHGKRATFHMTYHNRATISRLLIGNGFEPLSYPLLIRARLDGMCSALAETLVCVPRLIARDVLFITRMERELLVIARRL